MQYYLAPLEGITGYIFRNTYEHFYGGIDKYFSPFLCPNESPNFSAKEWNDISPEHNEKIVLVPQILTNHGEAFVHTAKKLEAAGYREINLNLGCPSGTVVSKRRGSGFLAYPEELDQFLEYIYSHLDMKISIKTRIGKYDPEEFEQLLEIYNKYPLEELIIHPRVQTDLYKNTPNLEVFEQALVKSRHSVCYNGDIFTKEAFEKWNHKFPGVEKLMIGRGIIGNPGLLVFMIRGEAPDKNIMKEFLDTLVEEYSSVLSGDRNVLYRMKELWYYMIHMFKDHEKYAKKIRKADHLQEYKDIVNDLFKELEFMPEAGFRG